MVKRVVSKVGFALALVVWAAHSAQAAQITGSADFNGFATLYSGVPGNLTTDLSLAGGVDRWTNPSVSLVDGDFDSAAPGTPAAFAAPWAFNSGSVVPFLQFGGFSFDLATSVVVVQVSNFLTLQGSGTLSGLGFDATPAFLFFTIPGSSTVDDAFRFAAVLQAQPDPDAVPAPASGLLLGAALLALGRLRRQTTTAQE